MHPTVAAPVLGSEAALDQGLDRPNATKQRSSAPASPNKTSKASPRAYRQSQKPRRNPANNPGRVDSREMGQDTGHGGPRHTGCIDHSQRARRPPHVVLGHMGQKVDGLGRIADRTADEQAEAIHAPSKQRGP